MRHQVMQSLLLLTIRNGPHPTWLTLRRAGRQGEDAEQQGQTERVLEEQMTKSGTPGILARTRWLAQGLC